MPLSAYEITLAKTESCTEGKKADKGGKSRARQDAVHQGLQPRDSLAVAQCS